MSLFAAGVVLFALLVASYSGRRFWIALASTLVSMAALIGFLFVAMAKEPSQLRTGLAWLGDKLPLVLDQQTADEINKAIERIPAAIAANAAAIAQVFAPGPPDAKPVEQAEAPSATTANAASVSEAEPPSPEPPAPEPEAIQATATPSWPAAKQEPTTTPGGPLVWLLDDQHNQASSSGAEGFAISGINTSDQAMQEVHAVLKPDGGQRELELALSVEGQKAEGVVPAGARFSLGFETPKDNGSKQFGGAILTFRYTQDGQHKTSIVYLTPSMISRLANRG
ncbi:MAG: hypothetical protein ACRD9W_03530 [Terriglobia bacterium]